MKKWPLVFFLCLLFIENNNLVQAQKQTSSYNNAPIQGNSSFSFDANRHILSIQDFLVPSWLIKVLSLEKMPQQYSFVETFSTNYPLEGWYPVDQSKLDLSTVFDNPQDFIPSKEMLSEGWFFTRSKLRPANIPKNGWYLSPNYHLFFNKDGIIKLHNFFTKHINDIFPLEISAPNKVNQYGFYRVIIQPNTDIVRVDVNTPLNWNLCYSVIQKIGDGERVYVLMPYLLPDSQFDDPQTLSFKVTYKNGKSANIDYKVFFDLQSGLGFYEPKK